MAETPQQLPEPMAVNDDSSDDDDNITIRIDKTKNDGAHRLSLNKHQNDELSKINSVMHASSKYTCIINPDLEIRAELGTLVMNSITPKTSQCIAVNFNKRILLIPTTQPLSSRMQSLFWVQPKQYEETKLNLFNNIDIMPQISKNLGDADFNNGNNPMGLSADDTFAVFSARYYYKTTMPGRAQDSNLNSNNSNNDGQQQQSLINTGFYYYTDFAVFILRDMKIIEYAIHGYVSNINDLLHKYNPKKIFYNSMPNKALDLFLRYEYQPFFSGIKDTSKLTPIVIHRFTGFYNTLAFCERQEAFCAFCNGLRDIRGLLLQLPNHQSLEMLTPTSTFTMTRRQLMQLKTTRSNQSPNSNTKPSGGRRLCSVVVIPEQQHQSLLPSNSYRQRHKNNGSRLSRHRRSLYPYHQQPQRRHLRCAPKKSRRTFS